MQSKVRQTSQLAMLTALGVVLSRVGSLRVPVGGIEGIRIGLGTLPSVLAGILWGPGSGFLVGAVGDVVGYFINPLGQYFPHFTLTAALSGALPALFLRAWGADRKPLPSTMALASAILAGQMITGLFLVPYFLELLFAIPQRPLLLARLVTVALLVPLYTVLIRILMLRLSWPGQLGSRR